MVLLPGLLLLLLVFLLREQTATARARAARKRARSKRVAEKHTRDASLDPPLPQPSRLCQDAAYPRGNHPNASWSDHEQLSQQARGARSLQNLRTGHPKVSARPRRRARRKPGARAVQATASHQAELAERPQLAHLRCRARPRCSQRQGYPQTASGAAEAGPRRQGSGSRTKGSGHWVCSTQDKNERLRRECTAQGSGKGNLCLLRKCRRKPEPAPYRKETPAAGRASQQGQHAGLLDGKRPPSPASNVGLAPQAEQHREGYVTWTAA